MLPILVVLIDVIDVFVEIVGVEVIDRYIVTSPSEAAPARYGSAHDETSAQGDGGAGYRAYG